MGRGCLPRFYYELQMPAWVPLWAADARLGSVMGHGCLSGFYYEPQMSP